MESDPRPLISTVSRPHPARLRLATYPDRHVIDARYGDMDGNGHLNNVALETIHENTRANLNRRTFPGVYDRTTRTLRIVAATNAVHFLNEAHWPATIEAAVGIGHVGRTSFVAATALFVDDVCISLCDTVLVLLDEDGPAPIPDDARSTLTSLHLRAD
ncbi:thioesterase family protein [Mycolicibacterium sp. CR10]|jgi:acyl-CoA thioester hydrolase|uniref:acyl-CoA thioesterase n=1 Tax=Mycolicibacterium sp. CR10 TaxID=2562314 RepID=UPI0010BFA885|nr:acyl-CoA thioesterase [Mycolicibacterium sp. CR10]